MWLDNTGGDEDLTLWPNLIYCNLSQPQAYAQN